MAKRKAEAVEDGPSKKAKADAEVGASGVCLQSKCFYECAIACSLEVGSIMLLVVSIWGALVHACWHH
jgi:hypothetical protein